jgi:hypothetical protein
MSSFVIVALKVFFESSLEPHYVFIAFEIDILVFNCAPEPLNKDIVLGPSTRSPG